MCLAVLAIDAHPDWPLIVAANRDEFHARPTQAMRPWLDTPTMLAGKDLLAGGTWLGITTEGKFALLTNVRDPAHHRHQAPTRGALVQRYLAGDPLAKSGANRRAQLYLDRLSREASAYNGFNLILGEPDGRFWHASNAQTPFYQLISGGVHGISNALLDTPWPKTVRTVQAIQQQVHAAACARIPGDHASLDVFIDGLLRTMHDTTSVSDEQLPSTGVSLARERLLASPFIVSDDYGTRCTTLLLRHRAGGQWVQEDTHDMHGQRIGRVRYCSKPDGLWQLTRVGPGSLNTD
jgi:uncharacterized protein with NRDE domain